MGYFDDVLQDNESLFLNSFALDLDYIPKKIPFREAETQYIADCMKPLFQNRNGKNLLVTGLPGIGKTVTIKGILRELNEKTDEIYPIYINCWKKDTSYKIAIEICDQIGYRFTQNRKTDDLLKEIANTINKKSAVFVLDEVDKLTEDNILYFLSEDIYRKSIIFMTNDIEWSTRIDPRIKSRLQPEELEFKPYDGMEFRAILKERSDFAFVKGVLNEEAFDIMALKSFEREDIRVGLFLLKEAGEIAESRASRKILFEHGEQAISRLSEFHRKNDFSGDEELILDLLKKNNGLLSSVLYNLYKQKGDKSYRTFQRKLKDLEKIGSLKLELSPSNEYVVFNNEEDKKLDEF